MALWCWIAQQVKQVDRGSYSVIELAIRANHPLAPVRQTATIRLGEPILKVSAKEYPLVADKAEAIRIYRLLLGRERSFKLLMVRYLFVAFQIAELIRGGNPLQRKRLARLNGDEIFKNPDE